MDLRKYLIQYVPDGAKNNVYVSLPNFSSQQANRFNGDRIYDVAWLFTNDSQHYDFSVPTLMCGNSPLGVKYVDRNGCLKHLTYGDKIKSFAIKPMIKVDIPSGVKASSLFSKLIKRNNGNSTKDTNEFQDFVDNIYFKNQRAYVKAGKHITNKPSDKICKELNEKYASQNLKHNGIVYFAKNPTVNCDSTKLIPEFDYNGKKYVRVAMPDLKMFKCADGEYSYASSSVGSGAMWLSVDDIEWEIANWDNLTSRINPKGANVDDYLELVQSYSTSLGYRLYDNLIDECTWENTQLNKLLNHNLVKDYGIMGLGYINECFEENKLKLKEITIKQDELRIVDRAYAGCSGLQRVNIEPGVETVGKRAFEDCGFNYVYKLKDNPNIVFDKSLPDKQLIEYCLDLERVRGVVDSFDSEFEFNLGDIEKDILITDILSSQKVKMPHIIYESLRDLPIERIEKEFCNFKFYKKQIANQLHHIIDNDTDKAHIDYIYKGLFNLASAIGCFSGEKIEHKGVVVPLSQKACGFLSELLDKDILTQADCLRLAAGKPVARSYSSSDLRIGTGGVLPKANANLLEFLSVQGGKVKFPLWEMVVSEYKDYPQLLFTLISEFNDIADARKTIDENGLPKLSSWSDVLPRYLTQKSYPSISHENEPIAMLFAKHNLAESTLIETIELLHTAESNNVPHNILSGQLKETDRVKCSQSLLDLISNYQAPNNRLHQESEYLQAKAKDKIFKFEWLDKYAPHNAILGLWTNCCATINKGIMSGTVIAQNSIVDPNCQNLVIRNVEGEIVAKAALYISKEKGEVLFNCFEVNEDYRNKPMVTSSGIVNSADEIFDAFKRGIYSFINVYNKENKNNPIVKVNTGYNEEVFKNQVFQLPLVPLKNRIQIPNDNMFKETYTQYSIYDVENDALMRDYQKFIDVKTM